MKIQIALGTALLLSLGCQRPEVEAFRLRPEPIVVRLEVSADLPDAARIKREYEAALRARLATRTAVVVEDAAPPLRAAELLVAITGIRPARRDPSPGAVGVATGIAVGTLSAIAGNRDAVFDGFWWGLWAGAHASAERRIEERSLGYRPNRISAVAHLTQPALDGSRERVTLAEFDVDGTEVIASMSPLSRTDQDDPVRIREEEARALAIVVVRALEERFGWTRKAQPVFYGLRPAAEPDPKPAPPAKESGASAGS